MSLTLKRIPILLLFFLFTPFVFAQYYIDLDESTLKKLESEKTFTQGDGHTVWEKMDNGTIIKYHFGSKKVDSVYTTDGVKKVYSRSGELLVESSNDSESVYQDGKLSNVAEGGVLKTYDEKGNLVSTKSSDDKGIVGIRATGKRGFDYETETKSGKVYISIVEGAVEMLRIEKGKKVYDYIKSSSTHRITKSNAVVWESVGGKKTTGSLITSIKVTFGKIFGSLPSKSDIEELVDFVETSIK